MPPPNSSDRSTAWDNDTSSETKLLTVAEQSIENEELLQEIGDNHEEAKRHNRDITKRKPIGFGIPLLTLLYCIGWHFVLAATMGQDFDT